MFLQSELAYQVRQVDVQQAVATNSSRQEEKRRKG